MSEENQEPIDEQQEEQEEIAEPTPTEPTTEEVTEESADEPAVEAEPVVEWFIQVADGKKAGPISFERLKGFAVRGKIAPKTNVRSTDTDAAWQPAALVPGLFPDVDPEEFAAPDSQLKEEPTSEEPEENVASSDESNGSVEVTDDSQATTIPKVLIDVGKKKDEKPAEKPKAKKAPAFVINTGASSKKKEEPAETGDATPPEAEPKPEEPKPKAPKPAEEKKSDASSVASSPGIKISIGAPAGKKEPKKEKSSAAFKFAIDPDASKKKEEKTEEIADAPVVDDTPPKEEPQVAQPIAQPQPPPVEKKDASSPGVKISIGAPAKKKTDATSDKKSGDKSAFKFAVKPDVPSEPKADERKASSDSTVVTKKPKEEPKRQEEDTTDAEPKKKSGAAPLLLRVFSILCFLSCTGSAAGLFFLGQGKFDTAFLALLAGVVFLLGFGVGFTAWLVASLFAGMKES